MTITISDRQRAVIVAALDCYSRLQMGQLWAINDAIGVCKRRDGEPIALCPWDIREKWTDDMAEELFGYTPGGSHGICSQHVPDSAKIAYDMQCVLRGDAAPLHTCRKEPLMKAKP